VKKLYNLNLCEYQLTLEMRHQIVDFLKKRENRNSEKTVPNDG